MAIDVGSAIAYLDLDTSKFKKGLSSALDGLKTFADSSLYASTRLDGLSISMANAGGTMSKWLTVPIVGTGAAVTKLTSDFETSMSKVQAISSATGDEMSQLRDKAIEMGAKTKFSAKESADAFTYMAMAGWDAKSMMNGISGIMSLAAADGLDLATTSDIVTDALTAFGLQASDSAHFADVLAQASSSANTNVSMLGESFKYVAPVAGSLGMSVEDVAIALGLMANSGIKSTQAGTALRSTLTNLAKPTDEMAMLMNQLGISITDTDGNMKSLREIMVMLREKFSGLTADEKASAAATLAGKEAMSGLLAIVNSSQSDFDNLANAIDNSNGRADSMADTMLDNLGGSITLLKSALEGLAIKIGSTLTPTLKKITDFITGITEKLNEMSDEQAQQIVKIAAVVAAIGPMLLIFSKVVATISAAVKAFSLFRSGIGLVATSIKETVALASSGFLKLGAQAGGLTGIMSNLALGFSGTLLPIMAVVAAIAVLVAAFVDLWKNNEEFRNNILDSWNRIKEAFDNFAQGIVDRINSLGFDFENLGEVFVSVWKGVKDILAPIFEGVFSIVAANVEAILSNILSIVDIIGAIFTGDGEGLVKAVKDLFGNLISFQQNVISTFIGMFRDVGKKILEIAGLNKLADQFGKVFDSIQYFVENMPQILSGMYQNVKEKLSAFIESIPQTIDSVIESIREKINEIVENVESFFTETLPEIATQVSEWFQNLPYTIGYYLGQAAYKVYEFGLQVVGFFTETIPSIIQSVVEWFAMLPSRIGEALLEAYNSFLQWVSNVKTWASEEIPAMIEAIKDFFMGLPAKIKEVLANAYNNVVSWGTDTVTSAKETGQSFIDAIIGFFKTLPDKIDEWLKKCIETIKKIKDKMVEAGKSVMRGFWDGLKEVWGKILDWFDSIGDKISSFFKGIKDGFNDAKDSAESLSGKVSGSHANGLSYVPYNGYLAQLHEGEKVLTKQEAQEYNEGRTGGNVYNFYGTEKLDQRQTIREFETFLKEFDKLGG